MSNVTLNDIAENEAVKTGYNPEFEIEPEFLEGPQQESKANEMLNRVLTSETGQGSIGDYIEHPMNFNQSKGLARVLRGLTGIVGNLNLAIIDVVLGVLEFSKEKRGMLNGVPGRSNIPS